MLGSVRLGRRVSGLHHGVLGHRSRVRGRGSHTTLITTSSIPDIPSKALSASSTAAGIFSSPSRLFSTGPFNIVLGRRWLPSSFLSGGSSISFLFSRVQISPYTLTKAYIFTCRGVCRGVFTNVYRSNKGIYTSNIYKGIRSIKQRQLLLIQRVLRRSRTLFHIIS